MPPSRTWTWFLIALAINFLLARFVLPRSDAPVKVSYTLFKQEVTQRNVREIYSRGESITGHFTAPVTYPPASDTTARTHTSPRAVTTFATTLPSFVDSGFEALLIDNGVKISAEPIDEEALLLFCQSTYDAAADLAGWDRAALDRAQPR